MVFRKFYPTVRGVLKHIYYHLIDSCSLAAMLLFPRAAISYLSDSYIHTRRCCPCFSVDDKSFLVFYTKSVRCWERIVFIFICGEQKEGTLLLWTLKCRRENFETIISNFQQNPYNLLYAIRCVLRCAHSCGSYLAMLLRSASNTFKPLNWHKKLGRSLYQGDTFCARWSTLSLFSQSQTNFEPRIVQRH